MVSYALVAWLLVGGQVHSETLDWGMSLEDCQLIAELTVDVTVFTEADVVPLTCEAEREA